MEKLCRRCVKDIIHFAEKSSHSFMNHRYRTCDDDDDDDVNDDDNDDDDVVMLIKFQCKADRVRAANEEELVSRGLAVWSDSICVCFHDADDHKSLI